MLKKTKKATSKKSVKKTTRRKAAKKVGRSKKAVSRKKGPVLVCAYGSECFWIKDGPILKDLIELRNALDNMSEDTYKHHVTRDRNDFADWVQFVLSDKSCASALRKSVKPSTAHGVLIRRLKYYHS